jgi:hypothetical protein
MTQSAPKRACAVKVVTGLGLLVIFSVLGGAGCNPSPSHKHIWVLTYVVALLFLLNVLY